MSSIDETPKVPKVSLPFRALDRWVFQQVDRLITSPSYNKLMGSLNSLTPDQRRIFNQVISFFTVFLPLFAVGIFALSNFWQAKDLKIKGEVQSYSKSLIAHNKNLQSLTTTFFAPPSFIDEEEIKRQVAETSRNIIGEVKFQLAEAATEETTNIKKVKARIVFNGIDFDSLTQYISQTISSNRGKILAVKFTRNEKSLLTGHLLVAFYVLKLRN